MMVIIENEVRGATVSLPNFNQHRTSDGVKSKPSLSSLVPGRNGNGRKSPQKGVKSVLRGQISVGMIHRPVALESVITIEVS